MCDLDESLEEEKQPAPLTPAGSPRKESAEKAHGNEAVPEKAINDDL